MSRGARWSAMAVCLLAACKLSDDLVAERTGSGGSAGEPAATTAGGAVAATGGTASLPACDASTTRVPVSLDRGALERCSGWAARRSFGHAVCTCGALTVPAALVTDAVDSGIPGPHRGGAAVGANGDYTGGDYIRIEGSLALFGTPALASAGGVDVAGDLWLRGAASAAGPIFVGRDAWLLAATSTLSVGSVGRNLHLGPDGAFNALGLVSVSGATQRDPFDFLPPCPCAGEALLDVAGIVEDVAAANANQQIGLAPGALKDAATQSELGLSCGRYVLSEISGSSALSLRIGGRVVLAVQGNAELPPDFSLRLDPGAELDWFIAGNLGLAASASIGSSERAASVRVYAAGSREIALPGTDAIAMNLYAPHAKVTVSAPGNVYGALFAESVEAKSSLFVHYDRAILRADETCSIDAPQSCASCDLCGSESACVAGKCAACTSDSDCCSPLVCEQGACQALPGD